MHAYYADHFVLPLPEGHRFPMRKYSRLRDRLTQELPAVVMREAPAASDGELALVHTPAYIQGVANGGLEPTLQRELKHKGTANGDGSYSAELIGYVEIAR
jgi:acetoin utilization deacetylase AcuC-like enzyme